MEKPPLVLPLPRLPLTALGSPPQPPAPCRLYANTRVPGAGSWDCLATDPAGGHLGCPTMPTA